MRLKTGFFPVVVIGIFFGIIGIGMLTGLWQTKVDAADVTVEYAEDIKGWMTLKDVSGYLNLPINELKNILGLPADTDINKPLKDIAGENGKETDDYREMLSKYLGESTIGTDAVEDADNDETGSEKPKSDGTGEEEQIKGRMTLKEVEVVSKVPADYICRKLGIPQRISRDIPLRDLAEQYNFEVDLVREIVAAYKQEH